MFEYLCPDCNRWWESDQCNPTREWCVCDTLNLPDLILEEDMEQEDDDE